MKNQESPKIKLNPFEIVSFFWISFAVLSLATALFGFFDTWSLLAILAILIISLIFLIKEKVFVFEKFDKFSTAIFAFTILLGIFLSFYTTPTIFGGRDEGSYSSSAILISQEKGLTYKNKLVDEFFKIYGPGKALNFPGFYYTENGALKSQFLPGYPSWIAIFYEIGGLKGIQFANLLPFITFLFSFFLIIRLLLQKANTPEKSIKKAQFISFTILATSFPLLVFYKFTLSEIYFAALCWFALYLILKYLENKSFKNYFVIFAPLILIVFIRIEAVAIIFFFILIMILKDANHLQKPRYQVPFVITGLSFIAAIYFEPNFFIDSLKNIIPFDINQNGTIGESNSLSKTILSDDWRNFYLLKIFFIYNLVALFAMAVIVVTKSILKFNLSSIDRAKKDISKINSYMLIPFVFFFPTFLYFFNANISLDHPWLLRRFVFSIIPILVLYSGIFLIRIPAKKKLLANLITIAIIAVNFSLFIPEITKINENFFISSQNKTLLIQTEKIAKNFAPNDLILISQQSSGSGWSLISEPMRNLMNLNAVYFFNPKDLEKINLENFDNVYLIASKEEAELYSTLNFEGAPQKYKITNNIITPSKNTEEKPQFSKSETIGEIYKIQK